MGSRTCRSAEPLAGLPRDEPRPVYNRGMRNDPPPASIELRLEPDQLALYWMPTAALAAGNTEPYSVALGWQTVAQAFGLRMPTPLSLENAIATVEDAVMPAGRWLAKPPAGIAPPFTLHTRSPLLREVAEVAGVALSTPPARLSRQAVENLFNRLSDQIHRPGVPDTALPQRAEWAAALLILREGLHHWGVEWVELG